MALISGLGDCGICGQPIQDPGTGVPGPVRWFRDHQLAHKLCKENYDSSDQRLYRAQEQVSRLEIQLASTQAGLESARAEVEKLKQG